MTGLEPVIIVIVVITAACSAALWRVLRRHRNLALNENHALRAEMHGLIAQLQENVSVLEKSAQQVAEAKGGLTRSMRAQAMQLLRSGMSPDSAAASLGIGRREVRLLSSVSHALLLK